MEFGRKWCRKYLGSAKFKYKAEKGSKKYIEEIELENEKTRLRNLIKNYKPEDVFNMAKVQLKNLIFEMPLVPKKFSSFLKRAYEIF